MPVRGGAGHRPAEPRARGGTSRMERTPRTGSNRRVSTSPSMAEVSRRSRTFYGAGSGREMRRAQRDVVGSRGHRRTHLGPDQEPVVRARLDRKRLRFGALQRRCNRDLGVVRLALLEQQVVEVRRGARPGEPGFKLCRRKTAVRGGPGRAGPAPRLPTSRHPRCATAHQAAGIRGPLRRTAASRPRSPAATRR